MPWQAPSRTYTESAGWTMSDDMRELVDAVDRLTDKVDRVASNLSSFDTICTVVIAVAVCLLVSTFLGCDKIVY